MAGARSPGLSFAAAPPASVPLRFLLSAPLFGLAAALVAAWAGPGLFASRWSPSLLAVTHLMTLGLVAMSIAGALLQFLPVALGAPVHHSRAAAAFVHAALAAGAVLLAAGLGTSHTGLLLAGAGLLGAAFAVLLAALAIPAWRSARHDEAGGMLCHALATLALTVLLGLALVAMRASLAPVHPPVLTDLHAQWGVAGWIGLTVAAVATKVVPMFQATPPYRPRLVPWLVRVSFLALAAASLAPLALPGVKTWADACLALALGTFALATLRLLQRRRRRRPDAATALWHIGMASLLGASVLWLAAAAVPGVAGARAFAPALAPSRRRSAFLCCSASARR